MKKKLENHPQFKEEWNHDILRLEKIKKYSRLGLVIIVIFIFIILIAFALS